jgi:hypothetical protein
LEGSEEEEGSSIIPIIVKIKIIKNQNPEGIESPFGIFTQDKIQWLKGKLILKINHNPARG